MRVAHVLTERRGGGLAYARLVAAAGRDRGDAAVVVAPFATGPGSLAPSRSSIRRIAAELRRADVVHAHGVRAALWCLLLSPPRLVLTLHGLHAVRRSPSGVRREAAQLVARLAMRRADAVICVSSDELTAVSAMSRSLAGRCRLILNGVEPVAVPTTEERVAARRRLGLASDARVLLFLGGLREQKNPLLALAAVRFAARRVPGLTLLVAGEGPLEGAVRGAASDEVVLLGWQDDPPSLVAACDAQLNTSRWEGLSLSLLEGLWRGRPAIATDAPGNAEAVGDAGLVVRSEAGAVAEAIERFFADPELRERLSIRARRRAETLFDAASMSQATLELYDEMVADLTGDRPRRARNRPTPIFGEFRR